MILTHGSAWLLGVAAIIGAWAQLIKHVSAAAKKTTPTTASTKEQGVAEAPATKWVHSRRIPLWRLGAFWASMIRLLVGMAAWNMLFWQTAFDSPATVGTVAWSVMLAVIVLGAFTARFD